MYTDHDIFTNNKREKPFLKPDWDPYLFNSMNYLSPLSFFHKKLLDKVNFDSINMACMDYDILVKLTEITTNISHLRFPLCSVPPFIKNNDNESCLDSLKTHLKRMNLDAVVESGLLPSTYRIHYSSVVKPKVSIIITTKNNFKILKRCIKSIEKNTISENTWERF